ncbi:hypothetical protein MJO29_000207 [Puccinia striiformis f. sp. tritici]|nr:hypothetical protein MJO29_000207 [Puccinia striiformis f. sp. tritici]
MCFGDLTPPTITSDSLII